MIKPFSLCADDFGLNTQVSQGILSLIKANRLTATSCMVNLKGFERYSTQLLELQSQVNIGLHFNLTQGPWLSAPHRTMGLTEVLVRTHLGLFSAQSLRAEFMAQLNRFVEVMGQWPAFIDGHQHVHQFPIIRQIILDNYHSHVKDKGIALRSTFPALTLPDYRFKAKILEWTGGRRFKVALQNQNIPHYPSFTGVYDFDPQANYRGLFRQWLQQMQPETLIMCHPAQAIANGDEIAQARVAEFEYLNSDAFIEDVDELGTCLRIAQQ